MTHARSLSVRRVFRLAAACALAVASELWAAEPLPEIRNFAAILSARCDHIDDDDCTAQVEYAIRTSGHSLLGKKLAFSPVTARLLIGGRGWEEVASAKAPTRATLTPIVFIDIGPPPEERHRAVTAETNPFTVRLRNWITHVAAAKPEWEYRFIAGDERICKISKNVPAHLLAHDPDAALRAQGNLPYERLEDMITVFRDNPHLLIVVAETPPIWLPREAAEWATYGNADTAERRKFGHEQQARVARTDVDADQLDYFAEDGFVIVAAGLAPQSNVTNARPRDGIRTALQKGVHDLAKVNGALLDDPAGFLRRVIALDIVEYRGTATARLPEIARPASGTYHAKVELLSSDTILIATNESPVMEGSGWNWIRRTLHDMSWVLMMAALLIALALIVALRRHRRSLEEDAAVTTRNALFATSGAFFAVGIGIAVDAASSLARAVATEATTIGALFLVLAFGSWVLRSERARK